MKNLVQKNLATNELGSVIELLNSRDFNANYNENIEFCLNSLQQALKKIFTAESPNINKSREEFLDVCMLLLKKIEESKLSLNKIESPDKSDCLGVIDNFKKTPKDTLKEFYKDFLINFFNEIRINFKDFNYFSEVEREKGEFLYYNSVKSLIINSDRIKNFLGRNIKTSHLLILAKDYNKIDETFTFFEANISELIKGYKGFIINNIFIFFASNAPNETFEDKLKYVLPCKETFMNFLISSGTKNNLNDISKFISNSKLTIEQTAKFLFESQSSLTKFSSMDLKKYWQIISKCKFDDRDKLMEVGSLLTRRLSDIRKIIDCNLLAKDLIPQFADLLSKSSIEDSNGVLDLLMGAPSIFNEKKLTVDKVLKYANYSTKPLLWIKTFFEHIGEDCKSLNPRIFVTINLKIFNHILSIDESPNILLPAHPSSPPSSPLILPPDDYPSSDDDSKYLCFRVKWENPPKNASLERKSSEDHNLSEGGESSFQSKRKRSDGPDPRELDQPSSRIKASFAKVLDLELGQPSSRIKASFAKVLDSSKKGKAPQI